MCPQRDRRAVRKAPVKEGVEARPTREVSKPVAVNQRAIDVEHERQCPRAARAACNRHVIVRRPAAHVMRASHAAAGACVVPFSHTPAHKFSKLRNS